MVVDNNNNNLISDSDDEPTTELEQLTEEACAALALREGLAEPLLAPFDGDEMEAPRTDAEGSTSTGVVTEIHELREELEFRVEMNGILQAGLDQQRDKCQRLSKEVSRLQTVSETTGEELVQSRRQLEKLRKKLAKAKRRERALLLELKESCNGDSGQIVTQDDDAVIDLGNENSKLKRVIAGLEARLEAMHQETCQPRMPASRRHGPADSNSVAVSGAGGARKNGSFSLKEAPGPANGAAGRAPRREANVTLQMHDSSQDEQWVLVGLEEIGSDTYVVNDGLVTIGSGPDCDIQLQSGFISRHHAELVKNSKGCVLADLNSTNGTFVNSRRIKKRVLRAGDVVTIGKHRFRYDKRPAAAVVNNAIPVA